MGAKTNTRTGLELGTRTRSTAATVRRRNDDYYVDGCHDEKKTKKQNQNKNKMNKTKRGRNREIWIKENNLSGTVVEMCNIGSDTQER